MQVERRLQCEYGVDEDFQTFFELICCQTTMPISLDFSVVINILLVYFIDFNRILNVSYSFISASSSHS